MFQRFTRLMSALVLPGLFSLAGPASANYAETAQGKVFIDEMVSAHGYDREQITRWLADASKQPAIIDSISKPAEKTLNWADYRRIFITPARTEKGKAFLERYEKEFDRAEAEFGVSRYVIAAIIGVETQYGEYSGRYRVVDALSTLAFDYPPRSRFFRGQLEQFFLMAREQSLDPAELKGSYAGAMGFGQFIPSSYRHYAVDFDGDGVADIVSNPVDAIGSVGNYFAKHRWVKGAPVAERVPDEQTATLDPALFTRSLKPSLVVGDYRKAGIKPVSTVEDDNRARLVRLQAEDGQQDWLTYHNFYVITRYNHSHLYAMAVLELSGALASDSNGPET